MERLAGRYELIDEVARGRGRTLWRGHDTVLDRSVGILLLDADQPHAEAVRQAAQRAAAVEHPGLLRVIDTAEDSGRVFVVTRWMAGTPLSEQLVLGPLSAPEARHVVGSVADALTAAAREGVHHLVLDPNDVLLTDHGVVVVGIGVRAALEGVAADEDAERVDGWRVGALLYATVTTRWPGPPCAGLQSAPVVGHRVARPRQVRAGVADDLDDIAWRALDPHSPHPLETPREIRDALAAPVTDGPGMPPDGPAVTSPAWRWMGATVVLALFAIGAVLVGWQVWQSSQRTTPPTSPSASTAPSVSPSPTTTNGQPLRVRSAVAFDPAGDGVENDDATSLAIDGDPTTAWTTVTYASRELGGLKPGVGLQLDLGQEQQLGGIDLRLVGRGSDVQVLAARPATDPRGTAPRTPDPDDPLAGFVRLGAFRGASDVVTLRFSPLVTTDRVLIWLTALPASADGYQGGVAEATLFS